MEILSKRWYHEYRRQGLHFPEIQWWCRMVNGKNDHLTDQNDSVKFKHKWNNTFTSNLLFQQFIKFTYAFRWSASQKHPHLQSCKLWSIDFWLIFIISTVHTYRREYVSPISILTVFFLFQISLRIGIKVSWK